MFFIFTMLIRSIRFSEDHNSWGCASWTSFNILWWPLKKSCEVLWGQEMFFFFVENVWSNWDRETKRIIKLHQVASIDRWHGLHRSKTELDLDLELMSNVKLRFWDHQTYHSMRLDETSTIGLICVLYIYKARSYTWKSIFCKNLYNYFMFDVCWCLFDRHFSFDDPWNFTGWS